MLVIARNSYSYSSSYRTSAHSASATPLPPRASLTAPDSAKLASEGVAAITRALSSNPSSADLYSDLGTALSSLGERQAAAAAYARAIGLSPRHAVAYNNLAALMVGSTQAAHRAHALQLYLAAHELQPLEYARFPQMHLNLASVLVDAGRYRDAIWHYFRGLAYATHAHDTLGRLIHLSQRVCDWHAVARLWPRVHRDLVTGVQRSAQVQPAGERPKLSPMHALTLPLSAPELLGLAKGHAAAIEADATARHLIVINHRPTPTALGTLPDLLPSEQYRSSPASQQLRVGFVSGDFKRHPVTILLAPALLACRSACAHVRLSLFALNPFRDANATRAPTRTDRARLPKTSSGMHESVSEEAWHALLRRAAHEVTPLDGLDDADAVTAIRRVRPHMLIDLHGLYSRGARPLLLAARPAPVQSTHLGFGASTGARFVDYVLGDRMALPPSRGLARLFSERFVLLPPSHLPTGHASLYPHMLERAGGSPCCRAAARAPGERRGRGSWEGREEGGRDGEWKHGGGGTGTDSVAHSCSYSAAEIDRRLRMLHRLPTSGGLMRGLVFAYLGQHLKVDHATYANWLSLLRLVPRSVLWLLSWPDSSNNLRLAAAAAGVDPRRIVFMDRLPQGEHLCAFGIADVALDSPAYASGATGIDVLWSGVPMLAMAGGMRLRREYGGQPTALEVGRTEAGSVQSASTIFQRNGVSLAAAAAQPNLVAHSAAGYVQLGLHLVYSTA